MKHRAPRDLQIPFDRVTYRNGQLLASRDLQDDVRANQRLRSLHTRYLHDTWGIALGFTVRAFPGDASVHVGPGYAIDNSARDILLAEDLDLPVPNTQVSVDLILVMNYQEDRQFRALPDLSAVCAGGGLDPRNERPVFGWRTLETLQIGPDVPLAKVTVQKGALIEPPDLSVRRNASRLIRPHIGFGDMEAVPNRINLFAEIQVDTSDAGFAKVPQYFARVSGVSEKIPGELFAFANTFAYIDRTTPSSFFYNVFFPFFATGVVVENVKMRLNWLGVEAVTGCEPVLNFRLFTLAGVLLNVSNFSKLEVLK
jgi:hypothetical protein